MAMIVFLLTMLALAALLLRAAVGDLRHYIIPNWLCGLIALLWLPYIASYAAISAQPLLPLIGLQLALAAAVFLLFLLLFATGAMGGGDVKLMAALALWTPWPALLDVAFWMALSGGLLALAVGIRAARVPNAPRDVPYGIAIAIGGMVFIGQHLFRFGAGPIQELFLNGLAT